MLRFLETCDSLFTVKYNEKAVNSSSETAMVEDDKIETIDDKKKEIYSFE